MKKMGYPCPHCGSLIPLDDINVSHNLALCRACSQTFPWADLENEDDVNSALSKIPPYLKVRKTAKGILLTYRKNNTFVSWFLIIFTLGWNGVVYAGLSDIISEMWIQRQGMEAFLFNLKAVFFTPFVFFGLVAFVFALLFAFGKTELEVGNGQGTLFRGIGCIGKKWSFLLSQDVRFSFKITGNDDGQSTEWLVLSQPGGKDFLFGSSMDRDTLEFIRVFLQKMRK